MARVLEKGKMEDNTLITRSANSLNCSTLCTGRSDYIAGMSFLEREEEEGPK